RQKALLRRSIGVDQALHRKDIVEEKRITSARVLRECASGTWRCDYEDYRRLRRSTLRKGQFNNR
ncbi:hypothetical protein PENTCL1PPCAC_778, partial [Pristionchus entomophagus]